VREEPSLKSKTIRKLPIVTPIIVISVTSESSIVNNYEEKWVEISYKINGKKEKGYVWGGLLAKTFVKLPEDIVLVGIT